MSERDIGFAVPVITAAIIRRVSAGIGTCCLFLPRMIQRSRQRSDLAEMDARMLNDIGLARSAAWHETRKWWWQA